MISVIVPVYEVEPYLRQCLDSIVNQTYRDIEILLIDDGSPDKCGEICEEYAKKDSRIRVFHTENQGLSAARNLGLREAKGEYIGFMDSDDWIEPDMYEILLRRLEETGTDICASGVRMEFQNKGFEYSVYDAVFSGTDAIRELFYGFSNGVWNKLYKKHVWANILFPRKHMFEDIATVYKVFSNAKSISCIPQALYHYRMRYGSIAHTHSMETIKDFWIAECDRYTYLHSLPSFKNDRMFVDKMEKRLAMTAFKIWGWSYHVPKEQRDYAFLCRVSRFVGKTFPLFGKKDWSLFLCAGILLTRRTNGIAFFSSYILISFSHIFEKVFPLGKREMLFRST